MGKDKDVEAVVKSSLLHTDVCVFKHQSDQLLCLLCFHRFVKIVTTDTGVGNTKTSFPS